MKLRMKLRSAPTISQNFVWFNVLALARLFSGRAEAGLEAAARPAGSAKLVDQLGGSRLLLRRAWEVGRSTTLRATDGRRNKTTRRCLGAS
jgi:16S rRNA G966 N2-methylase RsmD